MASQSEVSETSSLFERLLTDRDLSFFIPFILGFTNTTPRTDPQQENPDQETSQTTTSRDRIILINPFTQGMVVIEGTSSLESLLRDIATKNGPPPASRASIEALPSVKIEEGEEGECVVCLDEWEELGGVVKEMPCKHRFHGECIDKWLKIHGSCPVCRYKMPVEEDEVGKKRDEEGGGRERRRVERDIWVSFAFNSGRRSEDSNQTPSRDSIDSSPRPDHEMEG